MKTINKLIVAVTLILAAAIPASAQFHFGLKAGVAINSLKFDTGTIDSGNRAGFVGGAMVEFTMPVVGVGLDASVLYATRSIEMAEAGQTPTKKDMGYIDIPVNFKWKFGLPLVGKVVSPFLTTGPDFSFLCTKKAVKEAAESKSFDFAWNVGAGLEIASHVQLAASYGFAIGRQVSYDINGQGLYHGKNRCWTVTLAYLF